MHIELIAVFVVMISKGLEHQQAVFARLRVSHEWQQ